VGELILCNQKLATLPYYLEDVSVNVYSLEELSYYIESNRYLLGTEFMKEELCNWIEKELGLVTLAEQLRSLCREDGTLSEFVGLILQESAYCSKETVKLVLHTLQEMENKSDFECGKIRADRYMEAHKYINGIYEYRRLLKTEEKNGILLGNVWHNLGTAYARLFMFEEALACYCSAYEHNQNPESIRECLYVCRCMHDEKRFQKIAESYQVSAEEQETITGDLSALCRMDEIRQFEETLEEMFSTGAVQDMSALLEKWKGNYRKNCRI
jgi:tetratricopeptide (TPR) repeat protein